MIFHPVLNVFVLIVLVGGGIFVTVRNIVTAPTGARRWLWAERTLLVDVVGRILREGLTVDGRRARLGAG